MAKALAIERLMGAGAGGPASREVAALYGQAFRDFGVS